MSSFLRAAAVPLAALAAALVAAPSAQAARPRGELGTLQRTPVLTAAAEVARGGCPAVISYFSRGVGENDDAPSVEWPGRDKYYGGVGEEQSVLANLLADRIYPAVGGTPQVKTVANLAPPLSDPFGVGYPAPLDLLPTAVPSTLDSVRNGALAAIRDVNLIRAACPDARLVLSGYSQGAVVLRAALGASEGRPLEGTWITDPPPAGQAVAVVFGDPTWSTRPDYRTGTRYSGNTFVPGLLGTKDEAGLAAWLRRNQPGLFTAAQRALLDIPATPAVYRLLSVCHGRDPSCQFAHQAAGVLGLSDHLDYDVRDAIPVANLIADGFAGALTAAVPVPAVRIPEGQACLGPRGARRTVTVSTAASPAAGEASRVRAAWSRSGFGFTGRPAGGLEATVVPGAEAGLGVRLSASPLSNDLLQVTTPSTVSTAGQVALWSARLCPLG